MIGERRAIVIDVRSAVFITSENLFSLKRIDGHHQENRSGAVFQLASHAVNAINRLKKAGFMIIGLGRDEWFHGFATQMSCSEFLSASALDDVIIPHDREKTQRCTSAMIHAAAKWLLDLDRSFFISCDDEDLSEAQLTGCTPIRIGSEATATSSLDWAGGLPEIVDQILALDTASDQRF